MKRKLWAVFAADIVGYSGLMAEDEAKTIATLNLVRDATLDPTIARHGGRIVKLMGDGILALLPSASDAVEAALEIQRALAEMPGQPKFRIGVNVGDVIDDGVDVYGDAINVAARLESMAPAAGICLSALVQACLPADLAAEFTDGGSHRFKNLPRAIGVFSWPSGAALAPGEDIDTPGRPATVAMLPFEDMTGEPSRHHLAAGLNDDLLAVLCNIDEISLVTAMAAREGCSPARIGRELGVNWILRGSVRAAGNNVRAGAQLIESDTERTVWARRFDGDISDIFSIQDAIVEEVAATIQVTVADGDQAMVWRAEAGNPKAYQFFLEARASYKEYRRAGVGRARELYQRALEITPNFPAALVGFARTHIEDSSWGWSADPEKSIAEARQLLDRALEISPEHALASSEMAHLLMAEKRFEEGLDWAMRATRLAPTLGDAYHVCATLLNCVGRSEDALHYARQAIRRTPSSPDFYFVTMSDAYIGMRRWRESLALARRILARRPDWLMNRATLVVTLSALGQTTEARREVDAIRVRSPRFTASRWRHTMFYPDREDMPELEKMLIEAGLPK